VFDVHRISPKMKIQKTFGWKGVKHLLGKTPYQWKKKSISNQKIEANLLWKRKLTSEMGNGKSS